MFLQDPSLSFIKKHHFKDTLALLIVFLSFNHFASLILLVSFSIVTRSRNFLADCFIRFFLPKSHYNTFINDDEFQIKPVPLQPMTNSNVKGKRRATQTGKQTLVSTGAYENPKALPIRSLKKTILFIIVEAIGASLLKYYGDRYFSEPIENLAMSIVASSLVNDPKDALSLATTSSIIYALTTQWIQKVLVMLDFNDSLFSFPPKPSRSRWLLLMDKYPMFTGKIPILFEFLSSSSKYIRFASYLTSFHVVVSQIEHNINVQSHERKINEYNNCETSSTTVNTSSATASSNFTLTKELPPIAPNTTISSPNSNSSISITNQLAPQKPLPIYSSLVKDSSVNEISITSASDSNNQTWVPNITTAFSTESNLNHQTDLSNQVYKLNLDLDSQENCPSLSTISTVNLQNFVRQLFRWKNHHLIPPIWSIFTATQTLILEKNNLKASNDNVTPLTTTVPIDADKINLNEDYSANVKTDLSPTNSNPCKSVFSSKSLSDSMTLIAPAMDDYHKLNLVSTEFKNDYKVCITSIGPNSITFKIDNLFEGELIILVNGVIWSQVGSAIVHSVPGQEYTVVSGLVPLCSYDIQFVNRLNEMEDYLIADLMVRTIGKNGNQEDLDFSFPSYYHRKFLSPILTLKHSILTTNANLADERSKIKKTRKEATKKLNTMKQDIESFKSKIESNVTQDEKSASKVENLKMALKQGESQISQLEDTMKQLLSKEAELEELYLIEKDHHFQRTLEFSKAEDQWKLKLKESESQLFKLKQDLQQAQSKKEKSVAKHAKLQREVDQINDDFEKFSSSFLERKTKERVERNQFRAHEANEFELKIKGLEQDISRLEGEANHLQTILQQNASFS